MKKILIMFTLLYFVNIPQVLAKDTTFKEIALKMQESETKISSTCYSSNLSYNDEEITIRYSIKSQDEECHKFEKYLDKWIVTFKDTYGFISYNNYMNIGFGDTPDLDFFQLTEEWIEKLFSIIMSERNLNFTLAEKDKDKVVENTYLFNKQIVLPDVNDSTYNFFGIKYKDFDDLSVYEVTTNSITILFNPVSAPSMVDSGIMYKYNASNNLYEKVSDIIKEHSLATFQNLSPLTTYKFALVKEYMATEENYTEEKIDQLDPKKVEVTTLEKQIDDEDESTPSENPNENDQNNTENDDKNQINDIENPSTGIKISLVIVILFLCLGMIILKISGNSNKIFKI